MKQLEKIYINNISIHGNQFDLSKFRNLFEFREKDGFLFPNFDCFVCQPKAATDSINEWNERVRGFTICVSFKIVDKNEHIVCYDIITRSGSLTLFFAKASKFFPSLTFDILIRTGKEEEEWYAINDGVVKIYDEE